MNPVALILELRLVDYPASGSHARGIGTQVFAVELKAAQEGVVRYEATVDKVASQVEAVGRAAGVESSTCLCEPVREPIDQRARKRPPLLAGRGGLSDTGARFES